MTFMGETCNACGDYPLKCFEMFHESIIFAANITENQSMGNVSLSASK